MIHIYTSSIYDIQPAWVRTTYSIIIHVDARYLSGYEPWGVSHFPYIMPPPTTGHAWQVLVLCLKHVCLSSTLFALVHRAHALTLYLLCCLAKVRLVRFTSSRSSSELEQDLPREKRRMRTISTLRKPIWPRPDRPEWVLYNYSSGFDHHWSYSYHWRVDRSGEESQATLYLYTLYMYMYCIWTWTCRCGYALFTYICTLTCTGTIRWCPAMKVSQVTNAKRGGGGQGHAGSTCKFVV